jgi:hypothetical protein
MQYVKLGHLLIRHFDVRSGSQGGFPFGLKLGQVAPESIAIQDSFQIVAARATETGNPLVLRAEFLPLHFSVTIKALRMNGLGAHFDAKSASTMRATLNIRR